MTATDLIGPLDAADGVEPGRPPDPTEAAERASDAPFHARLSASGHPAQDEGPGELLPLIGVVPGEGPPVILLAGPLVLFGLALMGPFLLLLTLVALLVACGFLVALAGAIVTSPYLLVRRLQRHRRRRARRSAPAARFAPVDSARGPA